MVSVASVLAVSTLRPRDYTKYTARVYGPDPISGIRTRAYVRAQSDPERDYPAGGGRGLSEEHPAPCVSLVHYATAEMVVRLRCQNVHISRWSSAVKAQLVVVSTWWLVPRALSQHFFVNKQCPRDV